METLDRMVRALGPPQALQEVRSGNRVLAAAGRWRHAGGSVDLSGSQTFQLVFNVSGGQSVELRWGERSVRSSISAGSLGLVSPGNPTSVTVAGEADVLQMFWNNNLIEGQSAWKKFCQGYEYPPVPESHSLFEWVISKRDNKI